MTHEHIVNRVKEYLARLESLNTFFEKTRTQREEGALAVIKTLNFVIASAERDMKSQNERKALYEIPKDMDIDEYDNIMRGTVAVDSECEC